MFTHTIVTYLLIAWSIQAPLQATASDFTKYTLNYEQVIYSIEVPSDFYLSLNSRGSEVFSGINKPLTSIEVTRDTNPEIVPNKFEIKEKLITHEGEIINYYEDTQGELWDGVGCDIQTLCVFPELKKTIYQISCEGNRYELPMQEVCRSLNLH